MRSKAGVREVLHERGNREVGFQYFVTRNSRHRFRFNEEQQRKRAAAEAERKQEARP